jgi:hypothetical protein
VTQPEASLLPLLSAPFPELIASWSILGILWAKVSSALLRFKTSHSASTATAVARMPSGEPSIGVDYNPNVASLKHGTVNQGGVAFFTANLAEFRVSFDDCSSPANTLWEAATSPVETVNTLDPIGFCDHFGGAPTPGRVFQSQLAGATSLLAYSDNDGNSWTPSQGSGQPAGVDHQTLGAGPYNPNATPPPPPHPPYANAFYYCSQDSETAFCSRSDDGGLTFGPGVPFNVLSYVLCPRKIRATKCCETAELSSRLV